MAVPTYPSAITLADIQTEFGGSNPVSLNEYYSGGAYVGSGIANSTGTVIPTSGAITFLNFSGAVAWAADPTQPSVTQTYWHGYPSWGNTAAYIYGWEMTRTGDIWFTTTPGGTFMILDGSGAKITCNNFANSMIAATGTSYPYGHTFRTSAKNPNRFWFTTSDNANRRMIVKMANNGTVLAAANVVYPNGGTGQANAYHYIWDMAVTSGSSNTTTSYYPIVTSNTTSTNATFTICKVNATDMTTIEWAKTVSITPANTVANVALYHCWTNIDETELYVNGTRGSNATILVLSAADGSTRQSFQFTGYTSLGAIRKATSANNICLTSSYNMYLRSNTGANVTALGITSTSYRGIPPGSSIYPFDIDYDSNLYIGGSGSGTSNTNAMFAKYNSSLTRQWQVRIRPVDTANCVGIMFCTASNTRVALYLAEYKQAFDGKKWYISGYGERRMLYLSSASGNTGTFGRFIVESNTSTYFGAIAGPTSSAAVWSPRSTADFTIEVRANPSVTSNTATLTKTNL